jgi:hypothetical protein
MYQPYPSGGQVPEPQPQQPPSSVLNAVKLMYVGAGLSALGLIIGLATIGSLKSAILKADPSFTASQVHATEAVAIGTEIVVGLIGIGLWLWMASANKAGKSWARITGTVFFGINTLFLLLAITRPHAGIGLIFDILVWLVGLGAVIMLWRSDSGIYFNRPPQYR